jgi:hypothetical protein
VQAASEASLYSLSSLAGLGAALAPPPKVYLAATKADCVQIHVELGRTVAGSERRCDLFSGVTFLGAFLLNLEYIAARYGDPVAFMWWVVPHEMFHMYQRQSRIDWPGVPWAFLEAPADLHKLKVLDERGIISFRSYVNGTLLPRAREARRRWPDFSIQVSPTLTALNIADFYTIATALGIYLFDYGGWPKIIALNGPGTAPFGARFQAIYGKTLEDFEREFFAWLDRQ